MSCLDNLLKPVRQLPIIGGWCKTVTRVLCLMAMAVTVMGTLGTETAQAQPPAVVQVGGFNVQFWNMGDNNNSGVNVLTGANIPDGNLGTFTAAQQQAVVRALEYWTDRLGLPAAGANSPVLRFAINAADPNFNAFAASQGTPNGGGLTNTYDRLVNGANPQRTDTLITPIDGAIVFVPGTLGFDDSVMTQIPTLNSMEAIAIHEIGHLLGVANNVNVFDATVNFLGTLENQAWANNVVDAQAFNSTFIGANVQALFGGPLPVQNPDTHFLLNFANLTRATPFGKDFRNIPQMSPLELAAFVDLGYTVNLADNFGAAFYANGNGAQQLLGPFSPGADYAHGVFLQADNRNLVINGNINVTGFAATGVRINGGQEPMLGMMLGSKMTIAPGVSVNANADAGIGLLVSGGANNVIVHRGTINANSNTAGFAGQPIVIDFSSGLLNFLGTQVTSADYAAPLISRFDITGTVNTPGGTGNAIQIGSTAAVGEINVMNGAALNGSIISNALVTANLARPTITFGRTADANGEATNAPDAGFLFNYNFNITGTGPMNAQLVGGTTRFNGLVSFNGLNIGPNATLGGSGIITSTTTVQNMGTIAPGNSIGTLTILGSLNSPGGTFNIEAIPGGANPIPGVHNDLINVSGSATINGGTVIVDAAAGNYEVGSRYTFIQAGQGVFTGTRLTMIDNIANRRVVQFSTANTFGFAIARDEQYGLLGITFNQIAIGTYLDGIKGNPNVDLQTVFDNLDVFPNDQDVLDALDEMVGDIHGTLGIVSLQNTSQMYNLLSREMRGACCGCDDVWDGWILGYGRGGQIDYDGNAAGVDYTLGGTIFGVGRCFGGPRVGMFGNYAGPSLNSMDPIVRATAVSYSLGTFLEGYDDVGHMLLAGAVGYDQYETNRRIRFGNIDRMATAAYDGVQTSLYAEHDIDMSYYWPNIRPLASLQYVNVQQEAAEEGGAGVLNLAVDKRSTDSLRSFLGAQFRGDSLNGMGWVCSPQMTIGWQHEFIDKSTLYGAGFKSIAASHYTARGLDFGRNWGLLGLGLELVNGNHWSVYGGWDVYANNRQVIHTGSGTVSFAW